MSFSSLESLLKQYSTKSFPILGAAIGSESFCPLDLSVSNTALKNVNISSSKDLESYIWDYMKQHQASVAYGGYLEPRGIYRRSDYFNQNNPETERNIHLGLDLWIEADTPIYAPLSGKLHSFQNNTNYGDYGPTILLEHELEGHVFYTLYGHLSVKSLEGKQVGQKVEKGDLIATLGKAKVNGDYPPHLHFQIIKDLQGKTGDYPGVCNIQELEFYTRNCPDPKLLLKL